MTKTVEIKILITILAVMAAKISAQNVTVTADAGPDESISRELMSSEDACRQKASTNSSSIEIVTACDPILRAADAFDPKAHFIVRRSAYVLYASAMIRAKEYPAAISAAEKAVEVVQLGHDDGSGSSGAYGTLGQAQAYAGNLADADLNLNRAESFEEAALNTPAGKELRIPYSRTLAGIMRFHAQVLTAMGRIDAAKMKNDQASKFMSAQ